MGGGGGMGVAARGRVTAGGGAIQSVRHVAVASGQFLGVRLLGLESPAKIEELTLLRPIHGNL